ncbi:MAG: GTPase RsgA, partial [Spirochaetales bacterium]|nr:GTPase RsgA [Spirochaetales bacterium]
MAEGVVHWGIQNIFGVWAESRIWECRLKGKVLKESDGEYNPLSPGDEVEWEPSGPNSGMILARKPRRNAYSRWNKKKSLPQTLAVNLDRLILVTSPVSPPFRPRFLDRALLMAQIENLSALLVVNKADQGLDAEVEDRLATYQEWGLDVHLCSAKTGEGVEELKDHLQGVVSAVVGQSGV